MCVIFVAKDVRPTEQMIEQAWKKNSHGFGAAWRERDDKGQELVHWKKGIQSVEEAYELLHNLPLPYVAHFRIASSGGVRPDLCHPFPVCQNVPLALEGTTNGKVLFHNGDWSEWDQYIRYVAPTAGAAGIKLPRGKMNDTRAMAWLTHVLGDSFLELLPSQKGVLFGTEADGIELFMGKGWYKINDVLCSNDGFWSRNTGHHAAGSNQPNSGSKYTSYCSAGECRNRNLVEGTGRCAMHQIVNTTSKSPRDNSVAHGNSEVSHTAIPFPQKTDRIPLVSRELAGKLCPKKGQGPRRIPKGLYKEIIKAHDRLEASKEKKVVDRALQCLERASVRVYSLINTPPSSGLPA